ncbi:esterase/lipase family protein [Pseudoduganella sp. R-31]|uniref:esterase/lipase family protein n=1 Tax=Pseudoduganella sp. R-31 TaxID=3404060 RepID=UPI003CE89AFC
MANNPHAEPTRQIASRTAEDGTIHAKTHLTPKACTTRVRIAVPPSKVIPVIVIPGIMGSNLRARQDGQSKNEALRPGEVAWRPPNGPANGLKEAKKWKARDGAARQRILHGQTLDVDDTGEINIAPDGNGRAISVDIARERGWGEIHADSYGLLLSTLHVYLNSAFRAVYEHCEVEDHWLHINLFDRALWGATRAGVTASLTDEEIAKFAEFHYPVYACGYNWLESNELSSQRLEARIHKIIGFWKKSGSRCEQVVLVTHSMGGLVARACARRIPEKIKGVIHGVMPALGAPACYRRIACGTEKSSPSNGGIANAAMATFSKIAGETSQETTPVLAIAPGPLELLPNQMFPKPWLFAVAEVGNKEMRNILQLPEGSPYDLYREANAWYRLFDMSLVDPTNRYRGLAEKYVKAALNDAERFHSSLGDYYHPITYAYYCDDASHLTFGSCRWITSSKRGEISRETVMQGKLLSRGWEDSRNVELPNGTNIVFQIGAQDASGDGTVPAVSGAGPQNKVKSLFRVTGFDHQGSYATEAMLKLTLHLVVRIANEP